MSLKPSTGVTLTPDNPNGRVFFKQIPVDTLQSDTLFPLLQSRIREKHHTAIYNVNVHAFNIFHENPEFARSIKTAELVICDSDIIRILCRRATGFEPQKLTGSRWVPDFIQSIKEPVKIFLLGDEEQILQQCYFRVKAWNPTSNVRYHHGFFAEETELSIIQEINDFEPDILLVAMGMPKQELFLHRNEKELKATLRIPVGGAFRYWAGIHPQAPELMLKLNLEWLHRIWLEPGRLGKRYLFDTFHFFRLLLKIS